MRRVREEVAPLIREKALRFLSLLRDRYIQDAEEFIHREALHKEGLDVAEQFGWAALHFSASMGAFGLCKMILEGQGNAEAVCDEGNTAMHMAARNGHLAVVELLLVKKANPMILGSNDWTPMLLAAMNGHALIAKTLLAFRADPEGVDADGLTATMWAAKHGYVEVLKQALIPAGVDLTRKDSAGLTAFDHAREHLELRSSLVLAAELNFRLLDAAQRNDAGALRIALDAKANPNSKDDQGWTPLVWASLHDGQEAARMLIQHGACPALHGEAWEVAGAVEIPPQKVSKVFSTVIQSNSTLLDAAYRGDWAAAAKALEDGAFPDARDLGLQVLETGLVRRDPILPSDPILYNDADPHKTALMWAATRGDVEGIELLLAHGARIDERDELGWTATFYAVSQHHVGAVVALAAASAALDITSYEGETMLQLAVRVDCGLIVELMLTAKAEVEEVDYAERSPLIQAATNGHSSALRTLIFHGAYRLATDLRARTALHLSITAGALDCCEILLNEALPELEPWDSPKEETLEENSEEDPEESHVDEELEAGMASLQLGSSPASRAATKRSAREEPTFGDLQDSADVKTSKGLKAMRNKSKMLGLMSLGQRSTTKAKEELAVGAAAAALDWKTWRQASRHPERSGVSLIDEAKKRREEILFAVERAEEERQKAEAKRLEAERKEAERAAKAAEEAARRAAEEAAAEAEDEEGEDEGAKEEKEKKKAEKETRAAEKEKEKAGAETDKGKKKESEKKQGDRSDHKKKKKKAECTEPDPLETEEPEVEAELQVADQVAQLLEAQNGMGAAPLAVAAELRQARIVTFLLSKSADVEAIDMEGRTALMRASEVGAAEIVQLLLVARADVDAVDLCGAKALDLASNASTRFVLEHKHVELCITPSAPLFVDPDEEEGPEEKGLEEEEYPFRLRVCGLPLRVYPEDIEEEIRKIMYKSGLNKPQRLQILLDPISGRPKGIAFLHFLDYAAATRAMQLDGRQVLGHTILVMRDDP